MVNPYSNVDDTDKEEHFKDIVESVNIIIPLYPIQKKRNVRILLDIKTKVPEKSEEFESHEFFISRFHFYNIFGGVIWRDFVLLL